MASPTTPGNLINDGTATYGYDALGRMTIRDTTPYTYTGDGVLVYDGTTRYTQDLAAPLTQVLQTTQGSATTNYLYGMDRLAAVVGGTRSWYEYACTRHGCTYTDPFGGRALQCTCLAGCRNIEATSMKLKRIFGWRWCIAAAAMILVISGCRISGGALRGKEILFLSLPIDSAQEESITITSDRVASRSFIPVTVHTEINRMIVPDSQWHDLEQLRQSWCQQQPTFVSMTPNTTDYGIVLKCDWAEDAIYYAHPTDLPAPLRALIDLVPSTSERLLPQ